MIACQNLKSLEGVNSHLKQQVKALELTVKNLTKGGGGVRRRDSSEDEVRFSTRRFAPHPTNSLACSSLRRGKLSGILVTTPATKTMATAKRKFLAR